MNTSTERIKYIDGLRGLASLMVIFSHLVLGFYPILHSLNLNVLNEKNFIIKTIATTPINLIYSGFVAVYLFFLITGYLIGYNYFRIKNNNQITSSAFRRYFRLTIPTFFSCLIAYLLLKTNLFFNVDAAILTNSHWLERFYRFEPDFINMLRFSFYDVYFNYNNHNSYNNVLWIMSFELLGAMLIYSILSIFGKNSKRYIIYSVFIFICIRSLYLCFIIGLLLSDLNNSFNQNKAMVINNKFTLFVLFAGGIYLSSIKNFEFKLYQILNLSWLSSFFGNFLITFYNIIGVALILYVLSRSRVFQGFCENKAILFLGKISFASYLLHFLIICSFSCFTFTYLNDLQISYSVIIPIILVSTLSITIFVSYFFYEYIEKT